MCSWDDGGDGDLDNGRARLGEMVSEVTIYSQGWIWWHKSSIHEVKVMMENNKGLRWVWWNISCASNKRSIGSGLKYSLSLGFCWRDQMIIHLIKNWRMWEYNVVDQRDTQDVQELSFEIELVWKVFETPQLSRDNWEWTQVKWNFEDVERKLVGT